MQALNVGGMLSGRGVELHAGQQQRRGGVEVAAGQATSGEKVRRTVRAPDLRPGCFGLMDIRMAGWPGFSRFSGFVGACALIVAARLLCSPARCARLRAQKFSARRRPAAPPAASSRATTCLYFDADARKESAKEAGIFWAGDVTQGVPCRTARRREQDEGWQSAWR